MFEEIAFEIEHKREYNRWFLQIDFSRNSNIFLNLLEKTTQSFMIMMSRINNKAGLPYPTQPNVVISNQILSDSVPFIASK